jgi:hypothetical protein
MFKIEIYQTNTKGQITFSANGQFNADSSKDIAFEIADFTRETVKTVNKLQKLGVKGLSKARLKMSQPASFKITCVEDETSASFEIYEFGKFVADNLKNKKVETAVEILVDHTQTFADRWK